MAMQTYVFFTKDSAPTIEELKDAIKENGFEFELPAEFKLDCSEPTFFKCNFETLESGFDYFLGLYNSDDFDWEPEDLTKLKEPEIVAAFNTYSNAQEIAGMLTVSSVLTKITNGAMYSDFFDDELWTSKDCIEISKEIIENSRDQFSGPSKMRS
ncbi:hypothetical protein ISG33_13635 [Glaciecola sp. MH2013]|uniref:hypothetical protein n=1 Tax=Glaciecola sp. MH2013 TaxID=2785524 RepID=UPI00189E1488|nr:hypothetical protein [Glaciecola sp. MH2013]MBF7074443.1 hypothetical protein [Glaciecola sp. MH2013]